MLIRPRTLVLEFRFVSVGFSIILVLIKTTGVQQNRLFIQLFRCHDGNEVVHEIQQRADSDGGHGKKVQREVQIPFGVYGV